jgi:glyceraldehyde-3-phosphate dehydrogenase (NADP+)
MDHPMLLAGAWINRGRRSEIVNPEDGSVIGTVPAASVADVEIALSAAYEARPRARRMPSHMRQSILSKAANLLLAEAERFAALIATEGIKTIREARLEVARAATTLRLAGEEAIRLTGETIQFDQRPGSELRSGYYMYEPVGVIVAITPFNDPLNLVAHKIGPAIAAGNCVILKPHERTPLSALGLARLLQLAGLPDNILQVITGSGTELGDALVSDARTRMISFTGGMATGAHIASLARSKKLSMELGSNCPAIIMDDANPGHAVEACMSGAYWAAGQNCLHVQRILVQARSYELYRERFLRSAATIAMGPKLDELTDMGCLVDEAAGRRIDLALDAARGSGAAVIAGGQRQGTRMAPTLVEGVPDCSSLNQEEIYGPVTILSSFVTFDEAIGRANGVKYGLQAAIFTSNLELAHEAIDKLEVGAVMVNDSTDYRIDAMPFGGIKNSGLGREGIWNAVREMSEQKVACFNRVPGADRRSSAVRDGRA